MFPKLEARISDAKQSTLDLLLQRLQRNNDFPALSEAVGDINRIAASEKDSVNQLSSSILKDFALTSKLLKLVNAAFYGRAGAGSITTISRAVVMLGFDAVRSNALSLLLFNNLQDHAQAQQLKEEFVKVLFAGMLAREMAGKAHIKDAEEAFICAMFHNLGRTLAMFHFPEETAAAKNLMQVEGCSEAKASARALGLSFEELGAGIAKSWGFPIEIVHSMKKLPDEKIRIGTNNAERLRMLAGFSNELCEMIACTPEAGRAKALASISARYGASLPVTPKHLAAQVEKSLQDIAHFAVVVNVNLKQSPFARQALKWAGTGDLPHEQPYAKAASGPAASELAGLDPASALASKPRKTSAEIQSILTAGLKDVGSALIDDKLKTDDILRMILEVMYTGMGFGHVLLCLAVESQNVICGKFGFGVDVQRLLKAFRLPMQEWPDVFHVALKNNADILITDIDDPKIAARIPGWYRQHIGARTFVILPIVVKSKPVGMIYASRAQTGDITIPEEELSLLKALRNQAVLAIKQS